MVEVAKSGREKPMTKLHLDIIVPCYNEQECIPMFFAEVSKVMLLCERYTWSVCYIDDGSTDGSLEQIKKLAESSQNVKYVSFSRNFGKEAAIYAGLKKSVGDVVVLMDCDLQDPPQLLPEMLGAVFDGADSVATYRIDRKGEPPVRSWFAEHFYKLMNRFSDVKMKPAARDYRMMTRQYVDALLSLTEVERFSKGLFQWVGFNTKWIPYQNTERVAGETKWSFIKLYHYAISGIVAFSSAPLRIASGMGFMTVLSGLGYLLFCLIRRGFLISMDSIIISVVLLVGGGIILLLGIIGEYMARIYSEIKNRPIFIAREEKL
jgi:glycosyltransferase involved in cell wall biosynthesis